MTPATMEAPATEEPDIESKKQALLEEIAMMSATPDIYPSRKEEYPNIAFRQDPVVWRAEEPESGAITAEQLLGFERDGFVVLHDVFSGDEVDALAAEVEALAADSRVVASPEALRDPETGSMRTLFRAHRRSVAIAALACDPRLLDIAEHILGSRAYIHQSRANRRPGFRGRECYWHSDFETWHAEDGMPRMRALNASILLTDTTPCNGGLMFVPGSHKQFIGCVCPSRLDAYRSSLKSSDQGVPDDDSLRLLCDNAGIASPTARRGAVVLYDCNAMHAANGNITPYPRSNILISYNSVANRLADPFMGSAPRPEWLAAREDAAPLVRGGAS